MFRFRFKERLPPAGMSKSVLKHTFPDVDFALLGYNILKGYPNAHGHDPGFTFPNCVADYTAGEKTADCRYIQSDKS